MTTNLNPNIVDDEKFADELVPGTPLLHGQYVIEQYLNSGGFGITYLAKDSLHRRVVIKECFPSAFCRRSETIVGVRSRAHANEFRSIVKLFVQEARSLARLSHPNIVGVHQVFEDNDTAYMALDYVEGSDLLDMIEEDRMNLQPADVDKMLRRLLDAIKFIHSEGVLHRDISPDNILLKSDGEPVLIDFGAARETASKASRLLTAMRVVKDGYSPQEFYLSGSEQFPCSDLYALGASIYHLLVGETPPNSQERLAAVAANDPDPYVPIAARGLRGYERPFLAAIDKSLNVFPKDRLQSASEWLEMLQTAAPKPAASADRIKLAVDNQNVEARIQELVRNDAVAPEPAPMPRRVEAKGKGKSGSATKSGDVRQPVPAKAGAPKAQARDASAKAVAEAAPAKKSSMALLLGSVAVIAVVGVAVWQFTGSPAPQQEIATPPQVAAVESPVAAPVVSKTAVSDSPVAENPAPLVATVEPEVKVVAQPPSVARTPVADVVPDVATTTPAAPSERVEDQDAVVAEIDAVTPLPATPIASSPRPSHRPVEIPRSEDLETSAEVVAAANQPVDLLTSIPPVAGQTVVAGLDQPTAEAGASVATITDARVGRFVSMLDEMETQAALPSVDTTTPILSKGADENLLDLAAVMSGVAISLPFGLDASQPPRVITVYNTAPDWMEPGMAVISVNGIPVSNAYDINRVIKATTDFAPGDMVSVAFGIEDLDGTTGLRTGDLATVQKIVLLNGDEYEARKTDAGWVTSVVTSSAKGETSLQPGDKIMSYLATGEMIDGPDTLARIIDREVAAGTPRFSFAVKRGEGVWIVSMDYSVDLGN